MSAAATFLLVFTFTLADGRKLQAEQYATKLEEYKLVRTIEQCSSVALERTARMKSGLIGGNGLLVDVEIDCKQVHRRHQIHPHPKGKAPDKKPKKKDGK